MSASIMSFHMDLPPKVIHENKNCKLSLGLFTSDQVEIVLRFQSNLD
jgi:hypothetical protein